MKEGDVDYVAFLTDNKILGRAYASCPRRRALLLAAGTLAVLVVVALVAALARPMVRCPPAPHTFAGGKQQAPKTPPGPPATPPPPWAQVRLPDFAQPVHYELWLQPNLSTATSRGLVNISLQLVRPSDFLVLHAKNLSIAQVTLHGVEPVQVLRWELLQRHDQVATSID